MIELVDQMESEEKDFMSLVQDTLVPEALERERCLEREGGWKKHGNSVDGVQLYMTDGSNGSTPGIWKGVATVDFTLEFIHSQALHQARDSKSLYTAMTQIDSTLLECRIVETLEAPANTALQLVYSAYQAPGPVWDRDFCAIQYTAIIQDEQANERVWVSIATSVEDSRVPNTEGRVRGKFRSSGFVIREPNNPEEPLRITYLVQCDLGGSIPPGLSQQFGSIQGRCAGRFRDGSLALKNSIRILNCVPPKDTEYVRPNKRIEWIIEANTGKGEYTADVQCVADMDLWLEVRGANLVDGLDKGVHGHVLFKKWQKGVFSVTANDETKVVLAFHNPNWIEAARSVVLWEVRRSANDTTEITAQPTSTPAGESIDILQQETALDEFTPQRSLSHRMPRTQEDDFMEMKKLRGNATHFEEKHGDNFWNTVYIAQRDTSLDEKQQLQLWQRVHRAIQQHQMDLGNREEEKDPLRIAEQWNSFWNIVLLQQGHNLDEEEQQMNVWQRASIAVRKNQEVMMQGFKHLQSMKQKAAEQGRVSLWDRISQAVKEHHEIKRLEQEKKTQEEQERKSQELSDQPPNLWQKLNSTIQDYQQEHKEGKPLEPKNLQRLWDQINVIIKDDREERAREEEKKNIERKKTVGTPRRNAIVHEGSFLLQRIHTVVQDYQQEHKQGKPLDPKNLQVLWERVNSVIKDDKQEKAEVIFENDLLETDEIKMEECISSEGERNIQGLEEDQPLTFETLKAFSNMHFTLNEGEFHRILTSTLSTTDSNEQSDFEVFSTIDDFEELDDSVWGRAKAEVDMYSEYLILPRASEETSTTQTIDEQGPEVASAPFLRKNSSSFWMKLQDRFAEDPKKNVNKA